MWINNIKSSHVDGDEEEMVFCVWTPSIRLQSFSINVKCAISLMCVLLGGHPTETLPPEVQSGCFNTDIGPHYTFSATQSYQATLHLFCYTIDIGKHFSATQYFNTDIGPHIFCYTIKSGNFLLHNHIGKHFSFFNTNISGAAQGCDTLS